MQKLGDFDFAILARVVSSVCRSVVTDFEGRAIHEQEAKTLVAIDPGFTVPGAPNVR